MAQTKELFTRIMQKHDTEANWALKTNFTPLAGEIIVYDKDDTHNYTRVKIGDGTTKINNLPFTLPTASSSTLGGVKIGSNISISSGKISVPEATGSVKGVTIVYPAASCTTFSSDSGTVTPLAVQKGAKMFAITRPTSSTANAITRYSNTTGDVKDSKIKIEDVTNTRDTSKTANVLSIPAEGGKKMVYGYCTDQVDGTSFIGGVFDADATEFPYAQGLAIGGTSGNLLWKGSRVIDASCIGDFANKYTHPSYTARTGVPTANATPAFGGTFTVSQPVSDATGHITAINSRTITIPSSAATTSAAGLMSAADKTKLDGIATGANNYTYTLPNATSSVLGGVKIGSNISISSGTISLTKANVTAALGYTPPTTNTTYNVATTSANGLMSSTDKTNLNTAVTHVSNKSNPHSVTKSQVGLGNVTDDKQMPIAGGTFKGNVWANGTNRSNCCLRNIDICNSAGTSLISTNSLRFLRK